MNRAMDELPGLLNGSPSIHTSRPIPRSTERRPSSVSPEKLDKPALSLPAAQAHHSSGVITNNHQHDSGGPPIPTSELGPDSCTPAPPPASERLNVDLFEWPRIYYSLSKKEKEDEVHAVKSSKLPQGPKKRAKLSDKSTSQNPETMTTTTTNSSSNTTNNNHNHNNINGSSKNHGICENSVAAPVGGDVLLQWGHNKRSRGSRSDGGSAQGRQVVKIPRRTGGGGSDKPIQPGHQNHQAASAAGYTRGGNLRPCTPVREAHSRNLDELPTLLNGSPSSNNTRPISRSTDKRASASPDKAEKPPAACPPPPVPTNNSHHHHHHHHHHHQQPDSNGSAAAVEPTAPAVPEKVNMDLFEWPKIYISLSRKEKEDDFLAIKGTKLPQRPKRRAKAVDRNLQYCFPGMWLCDLSRGRYEVREKKCVKKKRRGLKGLESMDSDSE